MAKNAACVYCSNSYFFIFFWVENGQRPTRTKLKPMREISLDYISQNRKMKETMEQDKKTRQGPSQDTYLTHWPLD